MGAADRHVRVAAMLAELGAAAGPRYIKPHPANGKYWDFGEEPKSTEQLEIMTAGHAQTHLVYTPEQLDGDGSGARLRLLALMDAFYPSEAPHYWREFDLFTISSEEIEHDAEVAASEVVYAPKPWEEIMDLANRRDRLESGATFEPTGMRQSAILAGIIAAGLVACIAAKLMGATWL